MTAPPITDAALAELRAKWGHLSTADPIATLIAALDEARAAVAAADVERDEWTIERAIGQRQIDEASAERDRAMEKIDRINSALDEVVSCGCCDDALAKVPGYFKEREE